MLDFLGEHFQPGTYDMLYKNCNSFTDCALFFLCEQRLWPGFRVAERVGAIAAETTCAVAPSGIARLLGGVEYEPNPHATDFVLSRVLEEIASERAADTRLDFGARPASCSPEEAGDDAASTAADDVAPDVSPRAPGPRLPKVLAEPASPEPDWSNPPPFPVSYL